MLVEHVEVVDLREIPEPTMVDGFMDEAKSAPSAMLDSEASARFMELWFALPYEDQSRCHLPPFGVRFYSRGMLFAEISICWGCDNMYGSALGGSFHREFDGGDRRSQELLAMCEAALLAPPAASGVSSGAS